MAKLTDRLLSKLSGQPAPQRVAEDAPVLDAAEAYRRWSATYGDEVNELQQLEADLRGELLGPVDGQRVLDVGAGTGRVTNELIAGGATVVATDLVVEMLRRGPKPAGGAGGLAGEGAARACVAHAAALPFAAGSFDAVICVLTLGHVEELGDALASTVRLLRSGGTLLVTDFHPDATQRGWSRTFRDGGETLAIEQHTHTLATYESLLADLGCDISARGERSWRGSSVLFGLKATKRAAPTSASTNHLADSD